jgi:hypothetical protein
MVTLYDVVDIRTGKFHSVVVVKERTAKWFVKVEEYNADIEN